MAEKRITCLRCHSYDVEQMRCRLGKTNPRKKHEAQTVAELLGAQALCVHCPHREPLILRMRYPARRFVWAEVVPRRPAPPLEIEILYENAEETTHA